MSDDFRVTWENRIARIDERYPLTRAPTFPVDAVKRDKRSVGPRQADMDPEDSVGHSSGRDAFSPSSRKTHRSRILTVRVINTNPILVLRPSLRIRFGSEYMNF